MDCPATGVLALAETVPGFLTASFVPIIDYCVVGDWPTPACFLANGKAGMRGLHFPQCGAQDFRHRTLAIRCFQH